MSYIYVPITFVFQPGGTATGNVFTSWALLAARLKTTAGPKVVQIDDSFAPASVPVGVWDMSDTTIESFTIKLGTPTTLTLPDNAVLKNLLGISTGLNVAAQGVTQPSFQITSPGAVFVDRAALLDNQGTQPIVRLGATDVIAFDFQQGSFVDTAGPLMDLSVAGATGAIGLFTNSQAGNNTVVGVAGTNLDLIFDAGATPLPTNPGFAGTTIPTFTDQAFLVGYNPTTPGDWAPPPNNVGTALDQLATRVTTGFGAIIFKPGVPSAGDHVATWAEVQTFVTTTDGKCFVYVDDSVATAHVPGGSGVTNFKGRGEIRAYRQDAANSSTLTIDDGATLKGLFRVAGTIFIECDTRGVTPSLDWDYTPNVVGTPVPTFYVEEFASIGNAATATQPSIVVPANNTLVLSFSTRGNIFLGAATFLISLPNVNSILTLVASNSEICSARSASGNIATGPGSAVFQFDLSTWSDQLSPVRPVFTVGVFREQLLDIPIQSIIFRPGAASGGSAVATWAEVQDFITTREGQVTVYVDDSIVSPALVPGVTGITDCAGRVEIKAASPDSLNIPVLQIEAGATLRNLSFIKGVEVRSNATTPTPSLDYTTPNGGNLSISEFGALSNAGTATTPAIVVPAGQTFFLHLDTGDLILNAPAVPLFSLAATSTLTPYLFNASVVPSNYASGAGDVFLNYDNASAKFFTIADVPSPLPGLTGTYKTVNLDAVLPNPGPQSQATWFIDPQNVTGLASDDNSGIDATHPVLSYNNGVARKWTTYSPTLRQDTTLTWLSSQVGNADPVVFTPTMVSAVATLQAGLGAGQQIHAGNLAGVVPKNRAAAQLLEADLGFAAPIGSLVKNTQAGKTSFAWVYKNVAGTVFALSQPIVPATMPFDFATPTTEVDTWANGDTFQVFAPIGVNLVELKPVVAEFPATFAAPVQTYHLHGTSADGVSGDANLMIGTDVSIVECSFDSVVTFPSMVDDLGGFWSNDFFGTGVQGQTFGYAVQIIAGAIVANAIVGNVIITFSVDNDTIVDGTAASALWISSASIPALGTVYIAGSSLAQGDFPARRATIWGPGSLDIIGASRCFYTAATGAVATFLNTGGLLLNGQANANAFDPTTGLWSVLIPITAANLDLAFGAGGFGGLATNVGGASFSSQGFP
jgi:hypothetical protein